MSSATINGATASPSCRMPDDAGRGLPGKSSKLLGMNGRRRRRVKLLACFAAVVLAGLLGCGRHALKVAPGHDAGTPDSDVNAADARNGPVDIGGSQAQSDAAGVSDAALADAGIADSPADAPQVPDAPNYMDSEPRLDACVPTACHNQTTCDYADYCGTIGDGCGGTLDCPTICPRVGSVCDKNMCKGYVGCTPRSCTDPAGYQYCGDIGDGCGGALHCGNTCANSGGVCQNSLCVGPPSVCTPWTCEDPNGADYCGTIGDGCGGTLDCGQNCPRAGWICENSLCIPGEFCGWAGCTDATGNQFCGDIGDDCGGIVHCDSTCAKSGWLCENRTCIGPLSVCTALTCDAPSGDKYCGTIGDGCGRALACGPCSDGSTCGKTVSQVCGLTPALTSPPPPPPAVPPPVLRLPFPPPQVACPAPSPPPPLPQ